MATNLDQIADLFTILVNDHKLSALYTSSGSTALNNYLEGFLLYAVNDFSSVCTQSLTYDTTTQSFSVDLTLENKLLLAQIMVRYWLQKEVQDVLQMRMSITDRDFKHFSEAQNLKAKTDLYNMKREEVSQALSDYAYRNNTWTDWIAQDFS